MKIIPFNTSPAPRECRNIYKIYILLPEALSKMYESLLTNPISKKNKKIKSFLQVGENFVSFRRSGKIFITCIKVRLYYLLLLHFLSSVFLTEMSSTG